jgi:hypothetical protein
MSKWKLPEIQDHYGEPWNTWKAYGRADLFEIRMVPLLDMLKRAVQMADDTRDPTDVLMPEVEEARALLAEYEP